MKAVRMYAPRDLRVEEVEIPSYEADECLIKVMAVGVCGSDIPRVNHRFPGSGHLSRIHRCRSFYSITSYSILC